MSSPDHLSSIDSNEGVARETEKEKEKQHDPNLSPNEIQKDDEGGTDVSKQRETFYSELQATLYELNAKGLSVEEKAIGLRKSLSPAAFKYLEQISQRQAKNWSASFSRVFSF
jgi:hypothetical protein